MNNLLKTKNTYFNGNYKIMKKILRSKKNQKNNVYLVCALSSLAACNNDSKKILGLAGMQLLKV